MSPMLERMQVCATAGALLGCLIAGAAHAQPTGTIEAVSVTPAGAPAGAVLVGPAGAKISADHRFVVFASASDQLVAGDANGRTDVFLRDRQSGTTTLVSRAADGSPGNGDSYGPVISADGRVVAFVSSATNLVAGDANGALDVFVRDLQTGATELASVATSGAAANYGAAHPALSADGRYVAFESASDTLVPGDTNVFNIDVFLRDRLAGTTTRVSLRPDGSEIVGSDSVSPSISADGRTIAFAVVDNVRSGPTPQLPPNLPHGIYARDLDANATVLVSARPDGTPSQLLTALHPAVSADGRFVTFSDWEDLDPAHPDAGQEPDGPYQDVFIRDLQLSTTRRVSLPFPGGPAEESGSRATVSADGRYVAYFDRVRDLVAGTTTLVRPADGSPPNGLLLFPSISPDGRLVYFESEASNLVANDGNGLPDAFVYVAPPRAGADLSLTLGASSTQPAVDTDVTLSVAVANAGPEGAEDVAARVVLPAGVTFVSASGGAYASASGTWTIGALPSGATATLQIVVRLSSPANATIVGEVTAATPADPDSTPDNGAPTEDDQAAVTLVPAIADLSLALTANTPAPAVGANVTLTLVLSNAGPAAASGVAVRVALPAGLTFVSALPASEFDAPQRLWTAGFAAAGGARTLSIVARVTTSAPLDVVAQVSASPLQDPDSTPANDVATEDDHQVLRLTPVDEGIIVNIATSSVNRSDGRCSLIEAIVAANTDLPSGNAIGECAGGNGADTIHLRALDPPYVLHGVQDTTAGATGLPAITSDITIEGGGAAILRASAPGTPAFRLFYVALNGRLRLRQVTLSNGVATSPATNSWLPTGGAVLSLGHLELDASTVSGNTALCHGGAIAGGIGSLVLRNGALVQGNTSTSCRGGGIYSEFSSVTLDGAVVRGNSAPAGDGGGVALVGTAGATIGNSLIEGNSARLNGGGLLIAQATANVAITAGTRILANTVTAGHGGGVANGALAGLGTIVDPGGMLAIASATIANNVATGAHGGGINNAGRLTLDAVALTGNRATGYGGGVFALGPLDVLNSAVTSNSGGGAGGGVALFFAPRASFTGTTIAHNAGLQGGGLYWAAPAAAAPLVLDNVLVQQNVSADSGGGAYFQGGAIAIHGGSQFLGNTAAAAGGGFALALSAAGQPSTLTMTGGLVDGNTANGTWSAIGGGGGIANFDLEPGSRLTLNGVVLSNNRVPVGNGGGVFNRGTLIVNGGALRDNAAQSGGGLSNGTSAMTTGTATLTGVVIEANVATVYGGGVFSSTLPGSAPLGSVTIRGGTIRDNRAASGGGLFNRGAATLSVDGAAAIVGNTASAAGGGLYNEGTATVAGSTIAGNTANLAGAVLSGGTTTIDATTVSGNTAVEAAGVRVLPATTTTVTSSTLSGNRTSVIGGALDISGTLNLVASTVADNVGVAGGISNDGRVVITGSILAGNRRPDGLASECLPRGPAPTWVSMDNVVGQDISCPISAGAAADPTSMLVESASVFTTLLLPLANNGGPTETHALRPGSLAIDGGSATCPALDQRGESRPVDGDGDGGAQCDAGAIEGQTVLPSPQPVLARVAPAFVRAGGPGIIIVLEGSRFVAGSIVLWNGAPRPPIVASATRLALLLTAADLASTADIAPVTLTVVNPGTAPSNTIALPIVSAEVGQISSIVVPPAASATAAALPTLAMEPGLAATLVNNGPGSAPATLSVAIYTANPTSGVTFAAGGFFDVQVTGADGADAVDVRFYYPSGLSAAAEAALQLQYWTGSSWAPVVGAGGVLPAIDTTDDLDATISGGRVSVRLDATSTPSILELGGTVFALVERARDTTAPATRAATNATPSPHGWFNAEVILSLIASDDGVVARTEFDLDGAGWQRYTGPLTIATEGVHVLLFRSIDAAGNVEATQKLVVRIDRTAPTVVVVPVPGLLWPANGRLRDVLMLVWVGDSRSGAAGFTLRAAGIGGDGTGPPEDVQGWSIGAPDVLGRFRATLGPGGQPRVYTVTYEGVDRAGNRATGTASVRVRP